MKILNTIKMDAYESEKIYQKDVLEIKAFCEYARQMFLQEAQLKRIKYKSNR